MPDQLLPLGVCALVLGVIALVAGGRGRRVNRDLVCRKCRYNLAGSNAIPERCPECGRALAHRRSIRRGERRRMVWVIAFGVLLLLAGSGGVGTHLYLRHVDGQAANLKPEWWLLSDVTSTSASRRDAAFEELHRRVLADELSDGGRAAIGEVVLGWLEDFDTRPAESWMDILKDARSLDVLGTEVLDRTLAVAERVLNVQADVETPWVPSVGRRLELLWSQDLIGDPWLHQYLVQAIETEMRLDLPQRVHTNTPFIIAAVHGRPRVSDSPAAMYQKCPEWFMVYCAYDEIRTNGVAMDRRFNSGMSGGTLKLEKDVVGSRQHPGLGVLGTHDIELDLTCGLDDQHRMREYAARSRTADPGERPSLPTIDDVSIFGRWSVTVRATIEVVADDTPVVELHEDPADLERFQSSMSFAVATKRGWRPINVNSKPMSRAPASREYSRRRVIETIRVLSMRFTDQGVPLCYRVFAVDGEREIEVGSVIEERPLRFGYASMEWPASSFLEELPAVDLEFRPDPALAEILGMREILGGVIRVEDVWLERLPRGVESEEALVEFIREGVSVRPVYCGAGESKMFFELELTLARPVPGRSLAGDLEVGERRVAIEPFALGPWNNVFHYSDKPFEAAVKVESSGVVPEEDLRAVWLSLRLEGSLDPKDVIRLGPFDLTTVLAEDDGESGR